MVCANMELNISIFKMFIIILFLSFINTTFALTQEEDVQFIEYVSKWRKGQDFALEDCLFYNFGYERELPYTMISLTPEDDMNIAINTKGMEVTSGCSLVLIGGKYVEQIDEVMKRVDEIVEQVQFVPLATFIFENLLYTNQQMNSSLRLVSTF